MSQLPTLREHLQELAQVHRMIASGKCHSTTELGKRIGASRRTIQRLHLPFLRELGAPIAYDPNKRGVHYLRPWDFGVALLRWLKVIPGRSRRRPA